MCAARGSGYNRVLPPRVGGAAPPGASRKRALLVCSVYVAGFAALYAGVAAGVADEPPAGDSVCFPVERLNDRTDVLVRSGTPPRLVRARLRLDRVLNATAQSQLSLSDSSFQASSTLRTE